MYRIVKKEVSVSKQAFHYAKDVFHFCPNG